jgi:electron transfer flavoprotein beta subunit
MKIAVPLRQVPDLVEDLELDESGARLDYAALKMKLNEFDDHALEEALLLKEANPGTEVIALAIEGAEAERMLFTALAKGADRAVKLTGVDANGDNAVLAQAFASAVKQVAGELVLAGVQSVGDRDGQLAPHLAARLGVPSVSVVTHVVFSEGKVTFYKEYAGGLIAEFEAGLPVVLGVQAARQVPRYAPVAKVRQVQQSAKLETLAVTATAGPGGKVLRLAPPEYGQGAKMLGGVGDLLALLKEKGVA